MAIEPKEMLKTVLLVEDSLGDMRLAIEAFQETDKSVKLSVVPDGVAAMGYLRREGKYAEAARPDLILLDLLPIREVWIHDEAFAASRLSMMRIMARRTKAATVIA